MRIPHEPVTVIGKAAAANHWRLKRREGRQRTPEDAHSSENRKSGDLTCVSNAERLRGSAVSASAPARPDEVRANAVFSVLSRMLIVSDPQTKKEDKP